MSGLRESKHLKLQLQEIQLATNNFETCIGKGGYGWVYKGQLSIAGKPTTVAVKRLNEQFGQGLKEFLTEIQLLTGQNHPNLISLLGYCDEGKEKIIVYEYAEHGSLDRHLSNSTDYPPLTWRERLRICIDAARGLHHLHNHVGKHQTVIHRDIKSANILLDENWVAKISDLGLSKLSLAGLNRSAVVSHPCGTPGYCEPEYIITGIVKKESDVYSFGMVLFEVLCGRLCSFRHEHDDGLLLSARLAKDCYEKKKLMEIIDPRVREEMCLESMNKFSAIAYACLQDDRGGRPPMDLVVKELIESLKIQVEYELEKEKKLKQHHVGLQVDDSDEYWETKLPREWQVITKMLNIPAAIYTNKKELFSFLRKGILFDKNNKFFWINNNGKICIWISARRFLEIHEAKNDAWELQHDSRFSWVAKYSLRKCYDIKCQIQVSMLSLGTIYAASLVFRPRWRGGRFQLATIKWRTQELSVCSTHNAELIDEDEHTLERKSWYKIKLWNFITHVTNAHFDIEIEDISYPDGSSNFVVGSSNFVIQGIEFQPLQIMQHDQEIESVSASDEDAYWEKKLPSDYQHYVFMSNDYLHYTTKKELYFLLCAGFLAYSGKLWFSLCKSTSGICSMLPASEILLSQNYDYQSSDTSSLSQSRFSEVKRLRGADEYRFTCKLRSPMFSPNHVYACYLVFKFADINIQLNEARKTTVDYSLDGDRQPTNFLNFNLLPPMNIPTIKQKNDYGLHDSRIEGLEMPDFRIYHTKDGWMQQRDDGWMEVMLCKPLHQLEDHKLLQVTFKYKYVHGIIVEGIEFRPMQGYS